MDTYIKYFNRQYEKGIAKKRNTTRTTKKARIVIIIIIQKIFYFVEGIGI